MPTLNKALGCFMVGNTGLGVFTTKPLFLKILWTSGNCWSTQSAARVQVAFHQLAVKRM